MVDAPSADGKTGLFGAETQTALGAIAAAQHIAFAPYVFHTSVLLRDWGILHLIGNARPAGLTVEEAAAAMPQYSHYALRVLLEGGLGIGLLLRDASGHYHLSKTGHFFANDRMTIVNTDFMRDVCLPGAADLESSLKEGRPTGLRHFGDWSTIYEGLSVLPPKIQKSWFDFDHFYSDNAFPITLKMVFEGEDAPKRLLDIGSNTGKWALACLEHSPEVHIGMVDLPGQLSMAVEKLLSAGYDTSRFSAHPHNVLDNSLALPTGYDAIWMSQFLDCFSDEEIVAILQKCHAALDTGGKVFINETFWDRQRFPASAFSLQMTSLYFTTIANGNSQMYDSAVFVALINKAGFRILTQTDNIGLGHTLLTLVKA
jgi:ubiquinone/menaquinone biosynthesis C-methylase UbiE